MALKQLFVQLSAFVYVDERMILTSDPALTIPGSSDDSQCHISQKLQRREKKTKSDLNIGGVMACWAFWNYS